MMKILDSEFMESYFEVLEIENINKLFYDEKETFAHLICNKFKPIVNEFYEKYSEKELYIGFLHRYNNKRKYMALIHNESFSEILTLVIKNNKRHMKKDKLNKSNNISNFLNMNNKQYINIPYKILEYDINKTFNYNIKIKPFVILKDVTKLTRDSLIIPYLRDDKILNYCTTEKYFNVIYKISITKKATININMDDVFNKLVYSSKINKCIKKQKLKKVNNIKVKMTDKPKYSDNELINLFDSDIKQIKKKEVINITNLNKIVTYDNISDTNISKTVFDTNISETLSDDNSLEEFKNNFTISFNKRLFFDELQKQLIEKMINELYDTNNKFKLLVSNYNYINIIKPIHFDNFSEYGHFNCSLYNTENKQKSGQLHFYTDNMTINNITKVESLL